jgi:hypothetical protein
VEVDMTTAESRKEELRIMSLPQMQEKFREAMGPWKIGDPYCCLRHPQRIVDVPDSDNKFIEWEDSFGKIEPCCPDALRLPLPIDPRNPERGLWGMVDKTRYRIDLHHLGATVTQCYSADGKTPFSMETFATPPLALLRALMAQERIEEVKG